MVCENSGICGFLCTSWVLITIDHRKYENDRRESLACYTVFPSPCFSIRPLGTQVQRTHKKKKFGTCVRFINRRLRTARVAVRTPS